MSGLDRAGYMQISKGVKAKIITNTMGAVSGDWHKLDVMSTEIQFAGITAPGIAGTSLITSKTTYTKPFTLAGNNITAINISAKCTRCKVIAYDRIVL